MQYYVESYWNFVSDNNGKTIDYTKIGVAKEDGKTRDGENWIGRNDGYSFGLYDSLEEAIVNAGYIADKILFEGLSDEDMVTANTIVKRLMNDESYLKEFGRNLEEKSS